ncbi:MAG: hypothetical protein QXW01_00765 [Candidatus Aenigmatarchaeota archaeon]
MILGYTFTEIVGKRAEISSKVDINSTIDILEVKENEIDIGERKKVIEIAFEFKVEYKPSDGKIVLKGNVLYYAKNSKDVVKEWEKNKKLPEEIDIEVKNFLLKKCLSFALTISEEIRMPTPIPFPVIVKKKEENSYIG